MHKVLMATRFLYILFLIAGPLFARNVIFVDNAQPGGQGTAGKPYATLAEAQAGSGENSIIYLAEGNAPYEGGISLKRGQMLIGAAFGLDEALAEFHVTADAPPTPAVRGSGPTIHGAVWLGGDNVVAGCTIAVEMGTAISCSAADLPVVLRKVFVRPSKYAAGITLQNPGSVSIQDGGLIGATSGTGLTISGGSGDVALERFSIGGSFGTAIGITGRERGKVVFLNTSPVKISDASQAAISLVNCATPVVFSGPLQIATHGGRGLFATRSKLTISGAGSSIATVNGAAVEIRDSDLDIAFEAISANTAPPGRLVDGMILDKVHGKFVVTGREEKAGSGGSIQNAQSYGIRIAQSSGIRLSHMSIADSGSADAICADAVERETNVRCRAAMYLRHVSASAFEDVSVSGGAGVGLNANNVSNLTFSGLQIAGAGSTPQEPAALLQEATGTIAFTLCRIAAGAGGAAVFEQRFNSARLTFTRCELNASQRPAEAPWLVRVRTAGASQFQIEFASSELHDNFGGGINVAADDDSRASLALEATTIRDIRGRAIDLTAAKSAHGSLRLRASRLYATGGTERNALVVAAHDDAVACVDLSGNEIVTGAAAPTVRLVSSTRRSKLQVIGDAAAGPSVVIDAKSPIAVVTACSE